MSISAKNLTTSQNTTDASFFVTASITPGANKLILAAVAHWTDAVGPAPIPTLSGNGITWVQVATKTLGSIFRLTLFRAMDPAPTTGAVTIDFGGDVQGQCEWSFAEIARTVTNGSFGSGAIVQVVSGQQIAAGTSITVTLAAFASPFNGTYGAVYANNSRTPTVGNGFLEIAHTDTIGAQELLVTEWQLGNDTTVDASWPSPSNAVAIAVEIAAESVPMFRGH